MRRRHMSRKTLAEESGLSYSFVKMVLRGERGLSGVSAQQLADALGAPVEDFIDPDAQAAA